MKAIVFDCLRDLVLQAFGPATWDRIADSSPIGGNAPADLADDHPDAQVLALFARTCEATGLDFPRACEAFGDHWVGRYLPARYPGLYDGVTNARDFILRLDRIHAGIGERLPGAMPPRHSHAWKDADTLVIGYRSKRDLVELFEASLRSVGKHFGTPLATRTLDRETVEVRFGG